jgi:hypothetical protein
MALTRRIADELVNALRGQMERCPGCHGIGRVRQSFDYQPCFCLVCEDAAKALYIRDKHDPESMAKLDNPKVQEMLLPIYVRLADAAREFAKRCPGCYGVKKVWSAAQQRPCLVCRDLHRALDVFYAEAAPPTEVAPQVYVKRKGRQL